MDKNLLKQDFYKAINGEWLKNAEIRSDRSSTGTFMILHDQIEQLHEELFDKWSKDKKQIPSNYPKLLEMIKFYELTSDWDTRNKLGIQPLNEILEFINGLNSFDDVFNNFDKLTYKNLYSPFDIDIYTNMKNSVQEILYLSNCATILPTKSMYENKEQKETLYTKYKEITTELLKKFNFSDEEIKNHIENAISFDEKLWQYTPSSEFTAEILNMVNIVDASEIKNIVKNFDIIAICEKMLNNKVEFANVVYLDFLKHFDEIINNETFNLYKSRLLIETIYQYSPYLTEELYLLSGKFRRAITGVKEAPKKELAARELALSKFSMVFGKFYGETYFGKEAKKDVEQMVQVMIETYKKRLNENTWLSKETIKQALIKLSSFEAFVGYPEKINPYYDLMFTKTYDEGSNIIENILNWNKLIIDERFSNYLKSKDKTLWGMSPATVNAYYSPTDNKIVFPAAILQAPFYSINQSSSQNFGGIGAVMAHEISHGFDNNGANFDENGNIKNWWTEEDYKNLKIKEQQMIELFDGIETEYGVSNGKLTVSENIADCGGVACAFESAKLKDDFNAKEFMINFATIWRAKYVPKYAEFLLMSDVHSLTKLRANIQLGNLDEFYEEFDITQEDKMYIAPEKRVKIW